MYKSVWISLLFIFLLSCGKKNNSIKPTVNTITQSVYASLMVEPDSMYEAFANVNGILESNLVSEGDLVKKGMPLFQIINNNTKLNAENVRLAYTMAQRNYTGNAAILESLKDEINAARLKMVNDSIYYTRQKNLWEQQIGSKAQLDAKSLAYKLSTNNVSSLEIKLNRTRQELETQLAQAANSYKNSLITTQDYTVTSKVEGEVYALYKKPGEIVTPQQPLAMLGSSNKFLLELLVDEVDIVNIAEGQKVVVTLDAYPNEIFQAHVTKIYPNKDERNQTFKVEARFVHPPQILYPGFSGEANIIVAIKENVLTIPPEYLQDKNKVNTVKGIIEVTPGLRTENLVEIKSGLTAETRILKPDNQ